ncbi:sulfur carrier protein ThiS [Microbacterium sp. MAH-37]|nr:sulfur carrier protein ThiS [Microbacterium sp. MAH-37]MVQ42079.1 sulfur carrier protein ThiS [Microbacterium sp. MAH-37]
MMTETIRVNGEAIDARPGDTLLDLVVRLTGHALHDDGSRVDGGRLGVAVAVGGAVVPRSRWSAHQVAAGDEIEIVTAVQGG